MAARRSDNYRLTTAARPVRTRLPGLTLRVEQGSGGPERGETLVTAQQKPAAPEHFLSDQGVSAVSFVASTPPSSTETNTPAAVAMPWAENTDPMQYRRQLLPNTHRWRPVPDPGPARVRSTWPRSSPLLGPISGDGAPGWEKSRKVADLEGSISATFRDFPPRGGPDHRRLGMPMDPLVDTQLRPNLGNATRTIRPKRAVVADWEELREAGRQLKIHPMAHLPEYLSVRGGGHHPRSGRALGNGTRPRPTGSWLNWSRPPASTKWSRSVNATQEIALNEAVEAAGSRR